MAVAPACMLSRIWWRYTCWVVLVPLCPTRSAIVYAFTVDGRGKSKNAASRVLSAMEFSRLQKIGLRDPKGIARYRTMWEQGGGDNALLSEVHRA